jgi:hypothetical protein
MQARAVAYPLAVLAIPMAWWLFARQRPFPVLADLLFTLPFLIDTAGNALDLYDTVEWWDDLNHFGNWMLLSAAFVALGWPRDAARLTRVALGVGFGATAAIVWEVLEYITFIPGSPEAATAYQDTLGDLGLGLLGSLIGASVAARYLDRAGRVSALSVWRGRGAGAGICPRRRLSGCPRVRGRARPCGRPRAGR